MNASLKLPTALYRGVTPVHFDSAADGVVAAHEAAHPRDKGIWFPATRYRDSGRCHEHRRFNQYHAYFDR